MIRGNLQTGRASILILGALLSVPALAQQAPLSASDWLRRHGNTQIPGNSSAWRPGDPIPRDAARLRASAVSDQQDQTTADIATSAGAVPVGVRRLGATDPDGTGIISARQAGLPDTFWNGTNLDTALRMIHARPALPASSQVTIRVIEAQLPPPVTPSGNSGGAFFIARADQLIERGILPSAMAMLQGAGQDNAATFQRLFNLSLLLGSETQACMQMHEAPGIMTDPAARIFCLAQSGDWSAAATLLAGARQLNMIDPEMGDLLARYLDDSTTDSETILSPYEPMTPLAFRLHESIGQPLPADTLDLKYAWTNLDQRAGWKAQLEAGERLARARALPTTRLHQLYSAQRPAASGGVWERAAVIQALDAALATSDPVRIGPSLTNAFQHMEKAGLRDAFAAMMAPRLRPEELTGNAARLALWLRLWNGETDASQAPEDELDAALLALATGGQPEALSPALGALAPVFATDLPPTPDPNDQIAFAPALYGALADADAGTQGDFTRAARGIQTLRQLGMIADARRIATQIALDPLLKGVMQ
ncbi:MAG: hypothetical protein ACK5II_13730 [Paracoccus sp. (in: a-proteobacteria)]